MLQTLTTGVKYHYGKNSLRYKSLFGVKSTEDDKETLSICNCSLHMLMRTNACNTWEVLGDTQVKECVLH